MEAKVTKTFILDDASIREFMTDRGYETYTEDDVSDELYSTSSEDLGTYGWESTYDTDVDVK